MSFRIRLAAVLAILALVAAACGGGSDDDASAEELPPNPAATCLAGDPDCDDIPGADLDEPLLEPGDPVAPGDAVIGTPIIGGGLTIADALSTDADGPLAVVGFLIQDADGARLCDLLLESLPPQCGGDSVDLSDVSTIDPDELKTAQGVTWTDNTVTVYGEIVNGVLTATPFSS
jgi:hypothetical protein